MSFSGFLRVALVFCSGVFLSVSVWSAEPLLRVRFSPENPAVNERLRIFLEPQSSWTSPIGMEVVLTGEWNDGALALLETPPSSLWAAEVETAQLRVGENMLRVHLWLEDRVAAEALRRDHDRTLAEILDLSDAILREADPVLRTGMEARRDQARARLVVIEVELAATRTPIGEERLEVPVSPPIARDRLAGIIVSLRNRLLLTQNSDGGWDFNSPPQSVRDRTNTSYPNQFGVHAEGVLQTYAFAKEPLVLETVRRTAEVLTAKPIQRKTRLYSMDGLFLFEAARWLGFGDYRAQALASERAEREFAAAMHILGQTNPTDVAVNAVPQAQIDAVSSADRVVAYDLRLAASGRNANLRAWDWQSRCVQARKAGQEEYARAIAQHLVAFASSLNPASYYYLLGAAGTISCLSLFQSESAWTAVAGQLVQNLLTYQLEEGKFMVLPAQGAYQGRIQDQAFVAEALFQVGRFEELGRLMEWLAGNQLESGAFDDFGEESVEGQSEVLSVLARIGTTWGTSCRITEASSLFNAFELRTAPAAQGVL
mgnify:CR=1 FL=1